MSALAPDAFSPSAAPRRRARWGTHLDSPAHFTQPTPGEFSLPTGYLTSTEALLGVAPLSNVSYVTQWQVWHKPYVREMLSEVERRAPEGVHWPLAVLASVASGYEEQGFSEYTMYATWLLARRRQQEGGHPLRSAHHL